MNPWPGACFALGYALAFGICALAAPNPRFRTWALCTMAGGVIGGVCGFGITLWVGSR